MKPVALTDAEVDARLTAGWQRVDGALQKSFHFPDYHQTIAFVNAVAGIAHRSDHHPDLSVHYNRCVVRYSTHDAGGISERDFTATAAVDVLGAT